MAPDGSAKVLARLESKDISYERFAIDYLGPFQVGGYTFGEATGQPLLLIHGSPGDWSAWENIIANDTILSSYYIIAIDRAGYGLTSVPAQAELANQSAAIWSVIERFGLGNIVVVGHSYGGAVVEQLLVDDDSRFSLAVMVAATASPELMAPRWYNKIASWPIIRSILSADLKSSNIEMMGLPESLTAIEARLINIETPIVFIQGDEDILVPYETADYFSNVKPTGVDYILPEGVNHFIPWSEPYLITDVLIKHINNED